MKIILFDIDETLISKNKYPIEFKQIKNLILKLKNLNYTFGVCTARPIDNNLLKIINDYEINGPLIIENGACLYKYDNTLNKFIYDKSLINKFDLNNILKNIITKFLDNNLLNYDVKITNKSLINTIVINSNRKFTSTIRIPYNLLDKINNLIYYIKNKILIKDINIEKIDNKIIIYNKNINKIAAIKKYFKNKDVILITDYEKNFFIDKNIKIYSVGNDTRFNLNCTKVFSPFGKGVKNILERELKIMKEYEQITENCKMLWKENFNIDKEKYTQVSGYIINENNQLLIVKNDDTWTIPGGHPEINETKIETLEREIMEESSIKIKDIKYLGAVEAIENNELYYQLRYTAKVSEILPFKKEWETCERKFIDFKDLKKYIKWADGITFSAQIESTKKIWNL